MEQNKELEVFGTLKKTETVFTIEDKILPGTLVFEALKPFPGYYYDTPMSSKPVYLYMALEEQYPLEEILRASLQVELDFDVPFEAGKCFMQIVNEKYNALRIRHLRNYDLVEKLQQSYMKQGIHFLRKQKRKTEEDAYIKIVKFFYLEEIDEGIFLDEREEFHAYIKIPKKLSWKEFEDLTMNVKYNWQESKFDAALGSFYYNRELHEVIRIYSNKIGLHYLQELKKLYLEKLK